MNVNSVPHVSVILSVFNGGDEFLPDTIKSILTQSFTDFEFIIVDDGSTDETYKILADFSCNDDRIRVLRNQKNLGLVQSLNRALDHVRTRFIARIDCGDLADNKRIELQYRFLRENPDYVLVASQVNWVAMQGEKLFTTKYPCSDIEIRKRLFVKDCILMHPTVMFKKIDRLYFREMAAAAEDYDYWLRLSMKGKFFLVNEPLITVRLNPDGTTYSKKFRQIKAIDLAHDWFLNMLVGVADNSMAPVRLNALDKVQQRLFHFFTKIAMRCHSTSKLFFIFFKLLSGLSSPYYMSKLIQMRLKFLTVTKNPMFHKYLRAVGREH